MGSSTNGNNTPNPTYAYSPSVPLSLYRELAAELQAAQVKLDSLNAQNQQLAKQNQQLRQEIETAVQSVLHLQQVVKQEPTNLVYSEKLFTEQEQGRYRRPEPPESPSQISGWGLAIAILLIIATAFGAGFLIVRPLLKSR
jgi:hypothetical protein